MDYEIKLVDHTLLANEIGNASASHARQTLFHETLTPVHTRMYKAAMQMHTLLWTTDQKSLRATDRSTVLITVVCTNLSSQFFIKSLMFKSI